ncbi:hypothetical protein AC249_AIPGENE4632 [Exaiptasia diaphana]|nr:hypothetical protein AC249_AIPGENE4632 [Exaiptasia diaphana]
MTRRTASKTPKYGLFYFKSDRTTSIVRFKNVVGGDTAIGSIVKVNYDGDFIEAEIIGAHDSESNLRQQQADFIKAPENAHRFTDKPTCSGQTKRKISSSAKAKENTAEPTMKKKKKKCREEATVICRIQALTTGSKETPSNVEPPQSPVFNPVPPPTLPNAVPPPTPMPIPVPPPTPVSIPVPPPTSVSTPVPRPTSVSTPVLPPTSVSTPVPPPPTSVGYETTMETAQHINSLLRGCETDPEVLLRLESLERQQNIIIDKLNFIIDLFSQGNQPQNECFDFNSELLQNAEALVDIPITSDIPAPTCSIVSNAHNLDFFDLSKEASSDRNFAVKLVRKLFNKEELEGRNVRGVQGKQPLDPARISNIKQAISRYFPVPVRNIETQWTSCRKAIDSYIRGMKFASRTQ